TDVAAEGNHPHKVHLIAGLNTITPDFVKQLGPDATGILQAGTGWSPDDKTNPAVKQFLKELKAAGEPATGNLTTQGLGAWAALHMVADLLEGAPTKDSATLIAKLNASGPLKISKYGLPDVDFSKPAFPNDPVLSKQRIFQNTFSAFEVNAKGKAVPLAKTFISASTPSKLKLLKF
ncbi:MAG: ABC transporter substrate-binding protein, partial [Actinomycetota bacterium]